MASELIDQAPNLTYRRRPAGPDSGPAAVAPAHPCICEEMRRLYTQPSPLEARLQLVAAHAAWAADVLADPATAVIDTETTGLHPGARIVELCALTGTGRVLLDTLIDPGEPIPPEAVAIHGITDAMVTGAPAFGEALPLIEAALRGRRIVIYNAAFDTERIGYELGVHRGQTLGDVGTAAINWFAALGASTEDAMIPYSEWMGEWSVPDNRYRRQRLGGSHRAAGDCRAVIGRLREMAGDSNCR